MLNIPKTNPKNIPHLTTQELREVDRLMVETYHISVVRMMECAGLTLAQLIRHLVQSKYTKAKKIVIAAGKGHNGGDGFVAARHLANWGFEVNIVLANPAVELKNTPLEQFEICQKLSIPSFDISDSDVEPVLSEADIIVDALLGFGITGNPRGNTAVLIEKINSLNIPVISLDIPSGLDSTTGKIYKPCIKADATLTLAMPKKGFLAVGTGVYLGDLYLSDIGVPPELYEEFGHNMESPFKKSQIVLISNS
ncbi:NAD(P)H-hydrate epimerase [Candidatus Margulisiibacteriota bacterium]